MRRWLLCALLVGCKSSEGGNSTRADTGPFYDPGPPCIGERPCTSYTCPCGTKFTTCASCRNGKWEWPVDDNCYFSCKGKTPPPTPGGCGQPLPDGFESTCVGPKPKTGSTACTDEMLVEIATCFGPVGYDAKRCAAIKAAAPDCAKCTLATWLGPLGADEAACVALVDAKSDCARTLQCGRDCLSTVCSLDDCDTTPGSGSTSERSQWQDCSETAQSGDGGVDGGGACASFAARRAACITGATAPCFPNNADDLLRFFRGACRDGGDWSKVGDAGAGDATPDSDAASDASGD